MLIVFLHRECLPPASKMKYIDQITDDWKYFSGSDHKPSPKTAEGTQLHNSPWRICYNGGERQSIDIKLSSTLKTYQRLRRQTRSLSKITSIYVYRESTIFLGQVGNKTPDEMNMHDQDVIKCLLCETQESNSGSTSSTNATVTLPIERQNQQNHPKKTRGKRA